MLLLPGLDRRHRRRTADRSSPRVGKHTYDARAQGSLDDAPANFVLIVPRLSADERSDPG